MDLRELKELIKLYETVKDTNISIQELIHYIETASKKEKQ